MILNQKIYFLHHSFLFSMCSPGSCLKTWKTWQKSLIPTWETAACRTKPCRTITDILEHKSSVNLPWHLAVKDFFLWLSFITRNYRCSINHDNLCLSLSRAMWRFIRYVYVGKPNFPFLKRDSLPFNFFGLKWHHKGPKESQVSTLLRYYTNVNCRP